MYIFIQIAREYLWQRGHISAYVNKRLDHIIHHMTINGMQSPQFCLRFVSKWIAGWSRKVIFDDNKL